MMMMIHSTNNDDHSDDNYDAYDNDVDVNDDDVDGGGSNDGDCDIMITSIMIIIITTIVTCCETISINIILIAFET